MTERPDPNDTTKCPLCGKFNACALATGRDVESCWCMAVTMQPSALASIPAEARGKICICALCASATSTDE